MAKLNDVALSSDAIENGVWVTIVEDEVKPFEVKVRSNKSKFFRARSAEFVKANEDLAKQAETDPIAASDKMMESLCWALISDWRGAEDDDGADIPFSEEKAKELMSDQRLMLIRDRVWTQGTDLAEYREQVLARFQG